MKKLVRHAALAKPILFASALVIILGAFPLLIGQSANFLGRDVSQVAIGIIGFYPSAAFFEALRIIICAFFGFVIISWPWSLAAEKSSSRGLRFLLFPMMPMLLYVLLIIGCIVKYPSLFVTYLPDAVEIGIHRTGFYVTPESLWSSALVLQCFSLPLIFYFQPKLRFFLKIPREKIIIYVLFFIGLGVICVVHLSAGESKQVAKWSLKQSRPNVLVLAVDSLRYDRLSKQEVTPAIQSLMADPGAVRFNDHHIGIPRTFPSWIELITGKYAPRTGIRHMFPGFGVRSQEFDGFVSRLGKNGYKTQIISDFAGDIFPRFDAGFQSIEAPNLTIKTMIRLSVDQHFPLFLPLIVTTPLRKFFPALKQSPAFADAAQITAELNDQIEKSNEPWLKVVFFSTAHFPYAAPHPYYSLFSSPAYKGPFRFEKNPELGMGEGDVSEFDKEQVRALYDGSVRSIDDQLKQVFGKMKALNLWDSTLIVLTADHGEDLYENGMLQGHGEHLRGNNVLHVPLIVKLPSHLNPMKREILQTTRSIDVGSTILSVCGLKEPLGDGTDLLPLIMNAETDFDLPAYAETGLWFSRTGKGFFQQERLDYPGISRLLSFDQGYSGEIVLDPRFEKIVVAAKHRSLIHGRYKVIYVPTLSGVRYQLFDRVKDPDNIFDLAKVEPVRLADMRRQLLDMVKKLEKSVTIIDDFVVPQ